MWATVQDQSDTQKLSVRGLSNSRGDKKKGNPLLNYESLSQSDMHSVSTDIKPMRSFLVRSSMSLSLFHFSVQQE